MSADSEWSFLLPRDGMGGLIAMLAAYFDDAGTHDSSAVIGFAGLIGIEEQWKAFEGAWKAKLRAPLPGKGPLKRFHMTDCMARAGEFVCYSHGEVDAVAHDFRQIIIGSGVCGYAVAVSRRDWAETVAKSPVVGWFGDDEAFCFKDCVAKSGFFTANQQFTEKRLMLAFDNRPHRTAVNEWIYQQYQKLPSRDDLDLLGLSFLDSTAYVPLQGADMFAWEFIKHCQGLLKSPEPIAPRPHARQFFESGRFHMGFVDRSICDQLVGLLGVTPA